MAGVAHTLKGSSAEVGALQLSELAATIEAAAKKSDQAALEQEFTSLVSVCKATRQHIAQLFSQDLSDVLDEHASG